MVQKPPDECQNMIIQQLVGLRLTPSADVPYDPESWLDNVSLSGVAEIY